jgi:hypothetical protein
MGGHQSRVDAGACGQRDDDKPGLPGRVCVWSRSHGASLCRRALRLRAQGSYVADGGKDGASGGTKQM